MNLKNYMRYIKLINEKKDKINKVNPVGDFIWNKYLEAYYYKDKIKEWETEWFYFSNIHFIKKDRSDRLNSDDFKVFLKISEYVEMFAKMSIENGQQSGEYILIITFYKSENKLENKLEEFLNVIRYNL